MKPYTHVFRQVRALSWGHAGSRWENNIVHPGLILRTTVTLCYGRGRHPTALTQRYHLSASQRCLRRDYGSV